jgi:4'-phosphopantetheinyl transferase
LWLLDGAGVAQDDLAFFTRCLGSSERRRLASFLRPERRRQFLIGRMLLRVAVSDLTALPIDTIEVVERPGNAPRLVLSEAHKAHPHFSLSHSRNWVACLISYGATLGLDIEVNDLARDIRGISEMVFHPSERRWLASRPDAERVSSFYDLWCEKEALHKLLCNLGRDPDLASKEALRIGSFAGRRRIRSLSGLSVVAVSDRRLFGIQEKILSGFPRADWMNGFTCKFAGPFDKVRVNG